MLLPTTRAPLTVSSAGVSSEYLEFVTRDVALMLLNRSPEGLDYWMAAILKLADPASSGKLKADLVRIVEEQRGSDLSQAFVLTSMKVDPAALTSDVHGTVRQAQPEVGGRLYLHLDSRRLALRCCRDRPVLP